MEEYKKSGIHRSVLRTPPPQNLNNIISTFIHILEHLYFDYTLFIDYTELVLIEKRMTKILKTINVPKTKDVVIYKRERSKYWYVRFYVGLNHIKKWKHISISQRREL